MTLGLCVDVPSPQVRATSPRLWSRLAMPAALDSAFPSLRRCLWLAIAAQLLLVGAGLRHHLVWGESASMPWLLPLLNTAEAGCLVLAVVAGGFAWWRAMALADDEPPTLRRLVWLTVPLLLAAILVPPFLTADPIDYVVRGRVLAVHGGNPYVQVATDFPGDPFLAFGDRAWKGFPLPYGPVLANLQGAIAWLAHQLPLPPRGELIAALVLFKLLFAGSLLVAAWALAKRTALLGCGVAARVFVAVAWNPLLLVEGVANAHNDPLLALCIALALLAEARFRFGTAVIALGIGVLTKVAPIVLLPLVAVRAVWCGRRAAVLGGGLGVLVLAAVFWLQFFRVDGALQVVARQGELQGASVWWAVHQLTGLGMVPLVWCGRTLVVAIVVHQAVRIWFDPIEQRVPLAAGAALAALACFGAALFGVWYHIWWVPLGLAVGRGFLYRFAVAASATSLLAYVPWTFARRLDEPAQWCNVVCALLLPALLALGGSRRPPVPAA